ncbi:MAG: HNH endonuclease [Hyphomicrobiales bacterium]|nr:HNH endonuclease [Hyphomicrobiales bacterium]
MSRVGGFSEQTIRTLAERAHHHCSNPDCGTQTVMPVEGSRKTLRVGEAAHIYSIGGDMPRFRADLSEKDLEDITNGIWLCRNCHAKIDKSGDIYSAELLFKWKSEHEEYVRSGFKDRRNFRQMVFSELDARMPEASSRARQIARDLPYAWEYRLTAEILYEYAGSLAKRAGDLRSGLYTLRGRYVDPDQYYKWFSGKMAEAAEIVQSEERLINEELPMSWGDPGVSGDKYRIYEICTKIRDAFYRQIEFEEDILFTYTDDSFRPLREFFRGFSYRNLEELFKLSRDMRKVFDAEHPTGKFEFELVVSFHRDVSEINQMAMDCFVNYLNNKSIE